MDSKEHVGKEHNITQIFNDYTVTVHNVVKSKKRTLDHVKESKAPNEK